MNRRKGMLTVAALSALGLATSSCRRSGGRVRPSHKRWSCRPRPTSPRRWRRSARCWRSRTPGLTVEYQQITGEQEMTTNLQLLASDEAPDIGGAPINGPVYTRAGERRRTAPARRRVGGRRARGGLRPRARRVTQARRHALQRERQPRPLRHRVVRPATSSPSSASPSRRTTRSQRTRISSRSPRHSATAAISRCSSPAAGRSTGTGWSTSSCRRRRRPTSSGTCRRTSTRPSRSRRATPTPRSRRSSIELKAMYDDQMFQDGILGMDKAATDALFASGNAGMIMGHSLTPAGLSELAANELNLDWVLLPAINPEQPIAADRLQRQHVRHSGERRQPRDGEEVPRAPDEPGDPGADPRAHRRGIARHQPARHRRRHRLAPVRRRERLVRRLGGGHPRPAQCSRLEGRKRC